MSMTRKNHEPKNIFLGKFGEEVASDFLKKDGYKIIGRNVKFGKHELDIIAANKNFLVFVEVKTRSCTYPGASAYGNPGRAVTYKKRTDTILAVYDYLKENGTDKQPRIDVIEIFLQPTDSPCTAPPQVLGINHIRNAFDTNGQKH